MIVYSVLGGSLFDVFFRNPVGAGPIIVTSGLGALSITGVVGRKAFTNMTNPTIKIGGQTAELLAPLQALPSLEGLTDPKVLDRPFTDEVLFELLHPKKGQPRFYLARLNGDLKDVVDLHQRNLTHFVEVEGSMPQPIQFHWVNDDDNEAILPIKKTTVNFGVFNEPGAWVTADPAQYPGVDFNELKEKFIDELDLDGKDLKLSANSLAELQAKLNGVFKDHCLTASLEAVWNEQHEIELRLQIVPPAMDIATLPPYGSELIQAGPLKDLSEEEYQRLRTKIESAFKKPLTAAHLEAGMERLKEIFRDDLSYLLPPVMKVASLSNGNIGIAMIADVIDNQTGARVPQAIPLMPTPITNAQLRLEIMPLTMEGQPQRLDPAQKPVFESFTWQNNPFKLKAPLNQANLEANKELIDRYYASQGLIATWFLQSVTPDQSHWQLSVRPAPTQVDFETAFGRVTPDLQQAFIDKEFDIIRVTTTEEAEQILKDWASERGYLIEGRMDLKREGDRLLIRGVRLKRLGTFRYETYDKQLGHIAEAEMGENTKSVYDPILKNIKAEQPFEGFRAGEPINTKQLQPVLRYLATKYKVSAQPDFRLNPDTGHYDCVIMIQDQPRHRAGLGFGAEFGEHPITGEFQGSGSLSLNHGYHLKSGHRIHYGLGGYYSTATYDSAENFFGNRDEPTYGFSQFFNYTTWLKSGTQVSGQISAQENFNTTRPHTVEFKGRAVHPLGGLGSDWSLIAGLENSFYIRSDQPIDHWLGMEAGIRYSHSYKPNSALSLQVTDIEWVNTTSGNNFSELRLTGNLQHELAQPRLLDGDSLYLDVNLMAGLQIPHTDAGVPAFKQFWGIDTNAASFAPFTPTVGTHTAALSAAVMWRLWDGRGDHLPLFLTLGLGGSLDLPPGANLEDARVAVGPEINFANMIRLRIPLVTMTPFNGDPVVEPSNFIPQVVVGANW